jgi:cytochrome o ubiquinol oxidase subunit IV
MHQTQTSIDSAGAGRGTFKSYTTGFVFALILTAVPFWSVMNGEIPRTATLITIFTAAAAQIMVHLRYFLHMDASSRARWNVLAVVFAVLIMTLVIGGTIWIMYHLNANLM